MTTKGKIPFPFKQEDSRIKRPIYKRRIGAIQSESQSDLIRGRDSNDQGPRSILNHSYFIN